MTTKRFPALFFLFVSFTIQTKKHQHENPEDLNNVQRKATVIKEGKGTGSLQRENHTDAAVAPYMHLTRGTKNEKERRLRAGGGILYTDEITVLIPSFGKARRP